MDTGSTASYIDRAVAHWLEEIGIPMEIVSVKSRLADGTVKELTDSFKVTTSMAAQDIVHQFTVMPTLSENVLLGDDYLKAAGIRLCNRQGIAVEGNLEHVQTPAATNAVTTPDTLQISHCFAAELQLIRKDGSRSPELAEKEKEGLVAVNEEFSELKVLTDCMVYADVTRVNFKHTLKPKRFLKESQRTRQLEKKSILELRQKRRKDSTLRAYDSPVRVRKKVESRNSHSRI